MRGVAQEWVMLAYRLPREPSTPRIALWRRLRRLGALQLVDGLVVLPASEQNREQLGWLADEVLEAHGEASVWTARPTSREQERALALRFAEAAAADYRIVIEAARAAAGQEAAARRRTLARLRRALGAIRARDPFPPAERAEAERAVDALTALVEVAP
jgi:hypothetical protein